MLRYGGQRCARRFHRRGTARCWSLTSRDLRRTRRRWWWRLCRRRRGGACAASKEARRRSGLAARGWWNRACWRFRHGVDIEHRGDSPADAVNKMLRSVPSCAIHAGRGTRLTGPVHVDASSRCAFDAVDVPDWVDGTEVECVAAGSVGVDSITFSGSCIKSCAGGGGGGCAVLIISRRNPKSIQLVKILRPA